MNNSIVRKHTIPNILTMPFVRYIERRRAEKTMIKMLEMSDHLLRDIGLSRIDITQALANNTAADKHIAKIAKHNHQLQTKLTASSFSILAGNNDNSQKRAA